MTLREIRNDYYGYTRQTSEIARYLALAGIGVIWIFRVQAGDKIALPRELVLPTALLIIGLALDLLQYVVASLIWGIYGRLKEKAGIKNDEEFKAPRQLNWPTIFFFWAKLVPVTLAYYFILAFLCRTFLS
jgi:hypothetical protein